MLDYTLPVAKRTRLREAEAIKEYYENKKKKEERNNSVVAESTSSLNKPVEVRENVNGLRNLRVNCNVGSEFVGISSGISSGSSDDDDDDDVDDDEEEEGDSVDCIGEDLLEREGGYCVDSAGFDDLEAKNKGKEKMGFEGSDDRVPIVLDDSEDDVVCLGEEGDFGAEKGENFVCVDVDVDNKCALSEELGDSDDGRKKNGGGEVSGVESSENSEDCSGDEISEEDSDDSEEDNDDSEDEDFGVEEYENSGFSEGLSSSGEEEEEEEEEDVDENEITDRGKSEGKKESRVEVGVKRKKAYGLDILVDSGNDNDDNNNDDCVNVSPEVKCVAKRTRSCFNSESDKKNMKFGTVSRPLCVEEELESLPSHDDNDDAGDDNEVLHSVRKIRTNNGKFGSKEENSDNERELRNNDNVEELRKNTKRKRIRALKNDDVLKILADSILDKVPLEDEINMEERCQPVTEIALPLKFTFGEEEPTPPEKSEYEKEWDKLWAEMEFALRLCQIGSTDPAMIENEGNVSPEVELDTGTLCHQGNHKLMLDEEIGIVCKWCSYVKMEIRYHVSPFCTDIWGKSDRREYGRVDQSIFDELQDQDSGCDSQSGSDPCAHGQGTVWDIIPGIKNSMYPHQREGFEFIWNIIAGGIYLDKLKELTSSHCGSGCIISHAPGTGKTRLTIVFLQTYMELFPTCRPVIIAPRSMLLTWEEEFQKWKFDIPFHILNKTELTGKESKVAVNLLTRVKGERNVNTIRLVKLYSWEREKSILGISYRLFKELAGEDGSKARRKTEDEKVRKILLELPGLFVFDEGHTARNDRSLMWKALSKIKTERRIILSGTPFQNNLDELFNTLWLVRPKFADSISSRKHGGLVENRGRKRNEARGKWTSLTSSIGKVTGDRQQSARIGELRAMIAPFVHVHKGSILQQSLPGLRHSVVVLQPAPVQKRLLEGIQEKNVILLDNYVSLVSVHPSLLLEVSFKNDLSVVDKVRLEKLSENPEAGVKTKFLMELLRLSEAINEKVLVFGQYIEPLTFIRNQLKSKFNWTEGNEVLYMDGKCDAKQRQASINVFNDPTSEVRIMLASIRACSEGISLVGASRVVLLDVVWNPSMERQAISRAYRIGQKKVVHIYHLITSGTMEEDKICRQAEKDRMSELLFSSSNKSGNQQKITPTVTDDKILEEMVQHEKLKHMFRKIIYQPKESDLIETFGLVDL